MNDGTWMIMVPIFAFAIALPITTFRDAVKLRRAGAALNPWLWAVFVAMPPFLGILVYAVLRKTVWEKQTVKK